MLQVVKQIVKTLHVLNSQILLSYPESRAAVQSGCNDWISFLAVATHRLSRFYQRMDENESSPHNKLPKKLNRLQQIHFNEWTNLEYISLVPSTRRRIKNYFFLLLFINNLLGLIWFGTLDFSRLLSRGFRIFVQRSECIEMFSQENYYKSSKYFYLLL